MTHGIAALSALFVWWFSTGLILWRVRSADNGGGDQHLWSVVLSVPLLLLGIWGVGTTLDDASEGAVYAAFLSALAIWGWIELAFLSGIVTGPNRHPCPPGVPGWERFVRAFGTLAWHEMLLTVTLIGLGIASRDAANPFAVWTFGVLFAARISAKLNLFFGVPRINTEFLPRPLTHLASHFRRGPVTAAFPIAVTALTLSVGYFAARLVGAITPGEVAGFALLTALTSLALLEHWFMVLPLPDQKLWRWMIPASKPILPERLKENAHGL